MGTTKQCLIKGAATVGCNMSRQQLVVLERVNRMHELLRMLREAEAEAAERARRERVKVRPPRVE